MLIPGANGQVVGTYHDAASWIDAPSGGGGGGAVEYAVDGGGLKIVEGGISVRSYVVTAGQAPLSLNGPNTLGFTPGSNAQVLESESSTVGWHSFGGDFTCGSSIGACTVGSIQGVSISGTPSAGDTIVASSASAAEWGSQAVSSVTGSGSTSCSPTIGAVTCTTVDSLANGLTGADLSVCNTGEIVKVGSSALACEATVPVSAGGTGADPTCVSGDLVMASSSTAMACVASSGDVSYAAGGAATVNSLKSGAWTVFTSNPGLVAAYQGAGTASSGDSAVITQTSPASDLGTADVVVKAMDAFAGASTNVTGGNVDLVAGTGATTNGSPGNVVAYLAAPTGSGHESAFLAERNGAAVGAIGVPDGYGALAVGYLWLGANAALGTRTSGNFALAMDSSGDTVVNSTSGIAGFAGSGAYYFKVNTVTGEIGTPGNYSVGAIAGTYDGCVGGCVGFAQVSSNPSGTATGSVIYADHATGDLVSYPLGATAPVLDVGSCGTGAVGAMCLTSTTAPSNAPAVGTVLVEGTASGLGAAQNDGSGGIAVDWLIPKLSGTIAGQKATKQPYEAFGISTAQSAVTLSIPDNGSGELVDIQARCEMSVTSPSGSVAAQDGGTLTYAGTWTDVISTGAPTIRGAAVTTNTQITSSMSGSTFTAAASGTNVVLSCTPGDDEGGNAGTVRVTIRADVIVQ